MVNKIIKSILDSTLDSIVVIDRGGGILVMNDGFIQMQSKETDNLIGIRIWDCFEAEFHFMLKAKIDAAFENGIPIRFTQKVHRRTYDIIINVFNEIDDQPSMCILFFYDITKKVETENELIKKDLMLAQSQKLEAMGTLVSGIAHEINNPINLITFNIPLIREVWQDLLPLIDQHHRMAPGNKYGGFEYEYVKNNISLLIDDVEMAANRVSSIVKAIKNFSRSHEVIQKVSISLNDAVTNALRLAQTSVSNAGVNIVTKLAEKKPIIAGHQQAVEQIVLNLVINAVQSQEKNQGWVKVETGTDPHTYCNFIKVSDNGCGIHESEKSRIFDPFYTTRNHSGGTGLGLSVTYNLTKALGGTISVSSQVGKGSTFLVSFASVAPGSIVLIVDNEYSVRDILKKYLLKLGFDQIHEATNGEEALLKAGLLRPDLMILDLVMPNMDGLQVYRAIRNIDEFDSMKLLITTGYLDDPMVEEVVKLGYKGILAKPFDFTTLYNCLQVTS